VNDLVMHPPSSNRAPGPGEIRGGCSYQEEQEANRQRAEDDERSIERSIAPVWHSAAGTAGNLLCGSLRSPAISQCPAPARHLQLRRVAHPCDTRIMCQERSLGSSNNVVNPDLPRRAFRETAWRHGCKCHHHGNGTNRRVVGCAARSTSERGRAMCPTQEVRPT
jgi:hypothetical protein